MNNWTDLEVIHRYLADSFDPTLSLGLIHTLTKFLEWFIAPMASKWHSLSQNVSDRSEGPIEKLLQKGTNFNFESKEESSLQQARTVEQFE